MTVPALYPVFLKLEGLPVVIVGGGPVAASKLEGLLAAGARITVVAPHIDPQIRGRATVVEAEFVPAHLDGARWVVAAATPEVNRDVAAAAAARGLFVNAVDDPSAATAYLGGVVRRGGVEVAVSTRGVAPALAGLLREALEAVLPDDIEKWTAVAAEARRDWKQAGVPMAERRPLLLRALDRIYRRAADADIHATEGSAGESCSAEIAKGNGISVDHAAAATIDEPRAGADRRPLATVDNVGGAGEVRRAGGFVSIVGGGLGDAKLLTVRAVERLREADLVLYDALLDPSVLAYAANAQRFYVGKRAGRHSIDQGGIHALMIRAANRGARVVRLKCGDPFVLGRGGEEALALEAAGVAYEVVPGLSSATAGPALAGIPLTHRGLAAGFAVVSGHAESAYGPMLDSLAPGAATVVVLMGLRNRGEIAHRMVRRGWSADTPAAIVLGASHPGGRRWLGTLGALADTANVEPAGGADSPPYFAAGSADNPGKAGVIVIGDVVRLADTIANEYETSRAAAVPRRAALPVRECGVGSISERAGESQRLRSTGE